MKTPPQPTAPSLHRHSPRWLRASIVAGAATFALVAGGFAACGGDLGDGSQHATGVDNGGGGADGSDAEFGIPTKDVCANNDGKILCSENTAITCTAEGKVGSTKNCLNKTCIADEGCVLCLAGDFSCQGTTVASCDASTNPPTWDLGDTCDQAANKICDSAKGACVDIQPTGSAVATGTYYQFGHFPSASSNFLGGYDVDTFENTIYVNRMDYSGGYTNAKHYLDAYTLELVDSDGDGKLEPNQHPDNPKEPGPIEERKLTHLKSYEVAELGSNGSSELYAGDGKVSFVGNDHADIFQVDLATGNVTTVVDAKDTTVRISHIGYDDVLDTWYGSSEGKRRVYAFHKPTKSWALQFEYPDMAGSHMDGIEVVTDHSTGTPYVYVSDMTSDYLGQYRLDNKLGWVQENVFEYNGTGEYVEGMGFGALNHFWATNGQALYEVGGGDLSQFVEPKDEGPK